MLKELGEELAKRFIPEREVFLVFHRDNYKITIDVVNFFGVGSGEAGREREGKKTLKMWTR